MIYIVELFESQNKTATKEKTFWDYSDAEEYVFDLVEQEMKTWYNLTGELFPEPKVGYGLNGLSVEYDGYPGNRFRATITEKGI